MDELLDSAPCGFLSLSDDGRILLANSTLLAMLGYKLAELRGQHVNSVLSVASRIFYQSHLFPLLKLNHAVEEIYLTLRTRQGTDVSVLLNATRRARDGAFVNDCILMKMRQRNQYEDEILRAKKAAEEATRTKDEFLAVVSHELRTPLTAILGWTTAIRMGHYDVETVKKALDVIERNARAQAHLIEDILDFSRVVSGKLRLEIGPVQPAAVIEAALDVVRPAIDAKGIRLHAILDAETGPIPGDSDRLQQVFWNLLSNAVKFTPEGGEVRVHLQSTGAHVEATVADTGWGIDAEFLPYVFDRFRQAEHSTTGRHDGLGLGLSITRHIVELHGGTIQATSAGEGLGASFTVRLSLMAPQP